MDALQVKLAQVREQRAHLAKLLAERSGAAETARALLEQESTRPTPRRTIESELRVAEMDVGWISTDLQQLESRIRVLEGDLAVLMTHDLELAQAEAARAAKAAKAKGRAKQAVPPEGGETNRAADASSQENPAPTGA